MRASIARTYGTAEVMTVGEVPVPEPGEEQLLIRVEASSLNALDWHFLTGTPYLVRLIAGLRKPKQVVLGADMAGIVVAKGSKVSGIEIGDRVFGESGTRGGFGPYALIRDKNVATIPDGVSFEAAGASGVAALTAIQALRTKGGVKAGDRVLINGAAGGVGTFAVQMAKALGARVVAVCSTRNVEMVKALGADEVIDYTTDDFVAAGHLFDVMIDNLGNRSAKECLSILDPGGRYVAVSGPKDNRWVGPMLKQVGVRLAFMRAKPSFESIMAEPDVDDLNFIGELLADGRVVPAIQRVVDLDGVQEAMAEIGTGHVRSKIVVIPK